MHFRSPIFCLLRSLIAVFVIALAFSCPVWADGDTASITTDIGTLEKKFFEHTYPNETTDQRLSRIEQLVFGETRTGSDQTRITNLLTAVPASDTTSAPIQVATNSSSTTSNNQSAQSDSSDDSYQSEPGDVPAADQYPRVTKLEQAILGHTFTNEPLKQRLDQLEMKAFGKRSTTEDLSQRVDDLTAFAQRHGNPDLGRQSQIADDDDDNAGPSYAPARQAVSFPTNQIPGSTAPIQQRVAWLEQQVFGGTFKDKHLLERLKNLDDQVFPNEKVDQHESLDDRVNSLLAAVEMQKGIKPAGGQPAAPTVAYGSQSGYTQSSYQPPTYASGSYGMPANTQYPAQQEYQQRPYYPSTEPPAQTGYSPPPTYAPTPTYSGGQQTEQQQQAAQDPTQHKSSLVHGLAKALGVVGGLALRTGLSSMAYGGYGIPGVGGYGW